jgi:hypothetical protein
MVGFTLLLYIFSGCNQPMALQSEYGKIRNEGKTASLNGTRFLAEMFRRRGVTVNRQSAISPRLNRYQTIVWFPDRHAAPEKQVVTALETWIDEGYGRTLIYVGRDYQANLDYLKQIRSQIDITEQEELSRRISEAIVQRETDEREIREKDSPTSCDWFKIKHRRRQSSQTITGRLIESGRQPSSPSSPISTRFDPNSASLEFSTVLTPPNRRDVPEQTKLLTVNGVPFVYSLPRVSCDGNIIVVNNGCFLLNFGLINSEHRKLAENLISECDPNGPVAFLESGPWEIRIQDRVDAHQPWAWISRPPLRYVVPHVLFWGVLFCFVVFPIFGRAKRFRGGSYPHARVGSGKQLHDEPSIHPATSTTSFRAHLVALGKMLQRSESTAAARQKVENYLKTYGKDSANQ